MLLPGWASLVFELFSSLFILVFGLLVVRAVLFVLERKIELVPLPEKQRAALHSLRGIVSVVLYLVVLMTALSAAGLDVVPLLTSLGVAGVAVSLAVKDILADYVAGLVLVLGGSVRQGEWIRLVDRGVEGRVEEIGWRHTVFATGESIITVPNRVVAASLIAHRKD